MKSASAVARAIAELAARQHGPFALRQLIGLGLSQQAVSDRVRSGRLYRVYRGVYALTPPGLLSLKGRWMAAVLACGEGAVLSYWDAAMLHGLRRTSRRGIDVTTPRRAGRSRPGITAHWSRCLRPEDITVVDGIPCTSVARTLLDLASVVDMDGLNKALERAERLRVFDGKQVDDVLRHNPTHPGAPRLRLALGVPIDPRELERLFARDCIPEDAPPYERNVMIEGHEGDFVWRALRLNIETDGGTYHDTVAGGRRDRPRDRKLTLARWLVVRFGAIEILHEPRAVKAEVRKLLAARADELAA